MSKSSRFSQRERDKSEKGHNAQGRRKEREISLEEVAERAK
jgi:hypothetical protein